MAFDQSTQMGPAGSHLSGLLQVTDMDASVTVPSELNMLLRELPCCRSPGCGSD